jgi:hypothetical protein
MKAIRFQSCGGKISGRSAIAGGMVFPEHLPSSIAPSGNAKSAGLKTQKAGDEEKNAEAHSIIEPRLSYMNASKNIEG